jgi:hypothetical protein
MSQMNFHRKKTLNQPVNFGRSETKQIIITDTQAHPLGLIQAFVDMIRNNPDAVPFQIDYTSMRGMNISSSSPLSDYFNHINRMMDSRDARLIYSPEVALFFDCGADCYWCYSGNMSPMDLSPDGISMAQKFNELVTMIRYGLIGALYKRAVRDREWNQIRDHGKAQDYVDALFACYARLLVIRIDLGYPYDPDLHANTHLDVLQQDMRRFKRRMSVDPLFKEMAGYLFKLEYGVAKGHHLHCMFLFDGSKVQKDAFIAQQIGELWEKITGYRGGFYNCNGKKDSYTYLGIGMINHNEIEKRNNLNLALSYFFKAEQYLPYRYQENGRGYFRGSKPDCSGKRLGRPRQISQLTR